MEALTKENFWNDLHAKFPDAVDDFCKWIDEYKKEVNWLKLFNAGASVTETLSDFPPLTNGSLAYSTRETKAPKFHDLPFDMQVGIIARYRVAKSSGAHMNEVVQEAFKFSLIDFFGVLQTDIQRTKASTNAL